MKCSTINNQTIIDYTLLPYNKYKQIMTFVKYSRVFKYIQYQFAQPYVPLTYILLLFIYLLEHTEQYMDYFESNSLFNRVFNFNGCQKIFV